MSDSIQFDSGSSGAPAAPPQSAPSAPAPVQREETGEMTPAERAYFKSRGQDTSGLGVETPAAPKQAPAEPNPASADDADSDSDELVIDENGTARNLKTGKFVPKSAYLRVKGEAKELKNTTQAYRDQLIATKERLAILTEASMPDQTRQAPATEAAPPDPSEDIFGYVRWQAEQIAKLQKAVQETGSKTQADIEAMRIQDAFKQDSERFQKEKPDFLQAFNHLVANRDAELQALGVADPKERQAQIQGEAREIIVNAARSGKSAAQMLYALAAARGYKAAANVDQAAAEIDRIKKGQAASQSLRGAGVPGVGETLTRDRIANMGETEYSETRRQHIAKYGKASWHKLMSG